MHFCITIALVPVYCNFNLSLVSGSVVDSTALAEALREGKIWGAGLDVIDGGMFSVVGFSIHLVDHTFESLEPNILADHPLVREPRLVPTKYLFALAKSCRSAVVLPHIGSATIQTRLDMALLTAQNLVAGIKGEGMPSEANI